MRTLREDDDRVSHTESLILNVQIRDLFRDFFLEVFKLVWQQSIVTVWCNVSHLPFPPQTHNLNRVCGKCETLHALWISISIQPLHLPPARQHSTQFLFSLLINVKCASEVLVFYFTSSCGSETACKSLQRDDNILFVNHRCFTRRRWLQWLQGW